LKGTTMRNEELERAQESLRRTGIDLALLAAPSNVCYISGWEAPLPIDAGWEFAEGVALVLLSATDGRAMLLCPDAWQRLAEADNRLDDARFYGTFGFDAPIDGVAAFRDSVRTALRDAGAGGGRGVLGIEPRYLPQRVAELIGREFGGLTVRDATGALREARWLKTAREIALIRRAVAAADAGQEELRRSCASDGVGQTEVDVYAGVHAAAHRTAGRPVPVVGELVTGARTGVVRYPGGPIDRVLQRGDTALQDISVRVNGYWADCTNTLAVEAEPTAEQRRYFRAARLAFEAAVEALRPGALGGDAVEAARRAMTSEGFDVTPYCGHQIGAAVNEAPRLVAYDRTPIEAGMVFAVEPGVYGGMEAGTGARLERVIAVRDDGPEILSTFAWGMEA
jgi:Xaa-Pro aminopeptidase